MIGNHVLLPVVVPGTLAANVAFYWTAPFDCRVRHVSAVAGNAQDATFTLGTAADPDAILTAQDVGDSNSPAEYGPADFAATNETGRITKGDTLALLVDYDGDGGTAAQNLSVVLTLTEG